MPAAELQARAMTKTERSKRTLPLPKVGADALRAHRARQNEARLMLGTTRQDQTGVREYHRWLT